jgi:hypothetical protein
MAGYRSREGIRTPRSFMGGRSLCIVKALVQMKCSKICRRYFASRFTPLSKPGEQGRMTPWLIWLGFCVDLNPRISKSVAPLLLVIYVRESNALTTDAFLILGSPRLEGVKEHFEVPGSSRTKTFQFSASWLLCLYLLPSPRTVPEACQRAPWTAIIYEM